MNTRAALGCGDPRRAIVQDPDRLLMIMNAILTSCGIEEIRQLVGGKHGTA